MSEEIKPHHLRALACDIEDCHNPQSWADYCRAAAAMLEIKDARIAELEAVLKPLSCSCTGFCGVMGWLPSDNDSCARRQGRAALEGGKQ